MAEKVDPYLHAVLLLHGAGKEITADAIKAVIKAAGIEPDEARAKVLAEAVRDVNFDELLENVTIAAAAPSAASPQAGGEEKKEEKKEEESEEKKEEEAAAGLASLFG